MKLKAVLESLDGLDDTLKGLYTERNGKFYIDAEGVEFEEDVKALKNALQRERDGKKSLTEQLKAFEGIGDPEKALEALNKLNKMEEDNLLSEGKLEELLEKRTENMRKDFENQVKALTRAADESKQAAETLRGELSTLKVDNQLQSLGAKIGVRPEAMEDFLYRGRKIFKLQEDGRVLPLDGEKQTIFDKDGRNPLSMEEWGSGMTEIAPHLFAGSSGGGASHQQGTGGSVLGKLINAADGQAMSDNIEAIARGEVRVQQ